MSSMDEAIRYVNTREKSLSLYIFSGSKVQQERIVQNTSAGGVTINGTLFHVGHGGMPFGGVGRSGMGAYHGENTFKAFSHDKPVLRKVRKHATISLLCVVCCTTLNLVADTICIPFLFPQLWLPDGGALSDPFFLYPPWSSLKLRLVRLLMKLSS